jgi:hypothetical protein
MRLIRVYHPYWKWEEVDANMWGSVKDRASFLKMAIEFTGDHERYGSFMIQVAKKWRYSCEHNLTDNTQNRKAWIGHAACALAMGCPEDIVRQAWGYLTKDQQLEANKKADEAIHFWENKYIGDSCQSEKLELMSTMPLFNE